MTTTSPTPEHRNRGGAGARCRQQRQPRRDQHQPHQPREHQPKEQRHHQRAPQPDRDRLGTPQHRATRPVVAARVVAWALCAALLTGAWLASHALEPERTGSTPGQAPAATTALSLAGAVFRPATSPVALSVHRGGHDGDDRDDRGHRDDRDRHVKRDRRDGHDRDGDDRDGDGRSRQHKRSDHHSRGGASSADDHDNPRRDSRRKSHRKTHGDSSGDRQRGKRSSTGAGCPVAASGPQRALADRGVLRRCGSSPRTHSKATPQRPTKPGPTTGATPKPAPSQSPARPGPRPGPTPGAAPRPEPGPSPTPRPKFGPKDLDSRREPGTNRHGF